eukprot:GILJ01011695.1.p1 GENE.GILJ01011695.1~~GILJ01011695.1.p1  ORF type:complete len:594 (-),score=54.56 GILJ01011695.1:88-1836(-)
MERLFLSSSSPSARVDKWSSIWLAFPLLALVRMTSAWLNIINDCDETYNYWEPTHYLTHGFGMQTWEYSPVYALRSYLYVGVHAFLVKLVELFTQDKIMMFYSVRAILGLVSAFCESCFVSAVLRRFGSISARLTLVFLLVSSGMFASSTAYLPSSTSMYMTTMALSCWFNNRFSLAVFFAVGATVFAWPFSAVIFVPLCLHTIYIKGIRFSLTRGTLSLSIFLIPSVICDYLAYHKWTIAVLNIFLYNSGTGTTGEGGGAGSSVLYGVEPWWFYGLNLILNFNVIWLLAPLSLLIPFFVASWRRNLSAYGSLILYISPMFIWIGAMSCLPHKEERFIYPVYPTVCLCGAITTSLVYQSIRGPIDSVAESKKTDKPLSKGSSVRSFVGGAFLLAVVTVAVVASLSRSASLVLNYNAPLNVWQQLSQQQLRTGSATQDNVCVGKEWYRFPTSYFLPDANLQLQYVKSGFTGLLPGKFAPQNGTWVIPEGMNDMNREEVSRYTEISKCKYWIDLELNNQQESALSKSTDDWEVLYRYPFLDSSSSRFPYRAFYIPFLSTRKNVYADYVLLRRVEPSKKPTISGL